MLYCEFCGKAFMRKFNLTRHLKTKHGILNNDTNTTTTDKDAYNINNDIVESINSSDTTENSIDGGFDINSRNEDDNDKENKGSQPLEFNNFMQEIPDKRDCYNQRVLAAAEAIKSKFNSLRERKNNFRNFENKTLIREDQEKTKNAENSNAAVLQAKLPELLQCALDILMVKELQNTDITDRGYEDNNGTQLKRPFNSGNEQLNESEMKTSEETSFKRLKYEGPMKSKNDDNNKSINSKYMLREVQHDPNTLVDVGQQISTIMDPNTLVNELRILTKTKIGQQISTNIKRLQNTLYRNHCPAIDKKRNELIQNLNELNQTNIGQRIRDILDELEKAEIIKPIDYVAEEEEEEGHGSGGEEEYYSTIDDGGIAGKWFI